MRSLLIADDERTIREGISGAIDWETLGISKVLLAADGREAYEIILKEQPDIAIVDIKMPEMTGLELISHFRQMGRGPEFVIISGFGEFEYAKEAIRNHVINYILKPCDISEISDTIKKIINDLEQRNSSEQEKQQMLEHINRLMPQAKEQMLREILTQMPFNKENLALFNQIFNPGCEEFQLLLFSIGDGDEDTGLSILKSSIDMAVNIKGWKFSVILHAFVVLVLNADNEVPVRDMVLQILRKAAEYSIVNIRAAVSGKDGLEGLPRMYRETREALQLIPLYDADRFPDALLLVDASTSRYSKVVRLVLQYARDHMSERSLSINQIASNILFMNPDYLGKLFKKEYGVKFSDYLMMIRMEKAKQIIMTTCDLRIYEVALQVGLDNVTYFSHLFRKYTGMLPSEYKASHSF